MIIEGTTNIRKVDERKLPVLPHFSDKLNTDHSKTQTKGSERLGINVIIKPLTNPLRRL
jgi:hypothetical protein